ncbi:Gfo/Idh/MocA family protein [Streptomyces boncukensis]|uniref:Gfo/Idh/MocA family oxidoreductase n=1 Tax=Streptomyces boncukensis TaxID=2711219 RepID=A0A6G4WSQ9_9ACTN|nr:Gfo/Idh/MocA family oxidoreductase [Streptomyces boncukensis]NGO67584.1 Gfo/Idh/MocA family oxidoreductase [Streptomyces boncukensis]
MPTSTKSPSGSVPRRPTRVAVVGMGWAGRSIWLPRLSRHAAYELVAAVDPAPEARAAAAETGLAPRVLGDPDELTPETVDLVVVAVPNHLHAPVACRLLARGLAVFVEKPVCLTPAEAEQLAAAEAAGGGTLLAGSAARYRADVAALHEQAASLGRLRHIGLSWVRASGVPVGAGWFTQRALAGGGALVDLGWHLLDTALPLLGEPDFAQVAGSVSDDFVNDRARRAAWRAGDGAAARHSDVEDTARAFLVTSGGVAVSLLASWASHERYDATTIRVEGSAGVASLRCTFGFSPHREAGPELTVRRNGDVEAIALPEEPVGAEYVRQLDALPGLLADPASRGAAMAEIRAVIGAIHRCYASKPAAEERPPVPAGKSARRRGGKEPQR